MRWSARSTILSGHFAGLRFNLSAGLLLAFPAAFAIWHFARTFSAFDWTTYAIAALALAAASLCAYYIPARRAMKVDPMVALRYE